MGSEIKSYRDLIVWQKSMALVTDIYTLTKLFPKEEVYGLTLQIRRCAISIPSNIAEGYGRNATGDYIRFLQIGIGSLYELQTQLEIAYNLEYVNKSDFEKNFQKSKEIDILLCSLCRKLETFK